MNVINKFNKNLQAQNKDKDQGGENIYKYVYIRYSLIIYNMFKQKMNGLTEKVITK
jgi:hypothetical protein